MFLDKMMSSEKRIKFVHSTIMILIFIVGILYIKEIISYKVETMEKRKEYLTKIENYYIIQKNPNKELILKELQEEDLDFLKNYYLKILDKNINQ